MISGDTRTFLSLLVLWLDNVMLQKLKAFRPMWENPRESWILDFTPLDSGFRILDSSLCQWNLDSGFQSLVEFRITLSCILDSKAHNSGFHKQFFSRFSYMRLSVPSSKKTNKQTNFRLRSTSTFPLNTSRRVQILFDSESKSGFKRSKPI